MYLRERDRQTEDRQRKREIACDMMHRLAHTKLLENQYILRGKSLAINFGDSQFRRSRTFNFIVSKIYVDKRSQVR